jgi:hypothetical protein
MNIFRKRTNAGDLWKSHVIAKLKESHCWICEHAVSEIDRDFFWFASEQYYEPQLVDKLRLAHGFCPTHTRHFLQTGANSVITAVFSYLAWYMIKQLNAAQHVLSQRSPKRNPRELCLEAAAILRAQGGCPMCVSLQAGEQINVHALTHSLTFIDVRDAYEKSRGLCLPHFRQAASGATWETVSFLTADMQRRLSAKMSSERSTAALLEQAVGLDQEIALKRDTPRDKSLDLTKNGGRLETYIELGKLEPLWSPTFEQLLSSLAEPGCPVCRACDQGVRRYFAWLGEQMKAQARTPGNWESSYDLCPAHLWSLYAAGYNQAAILVGKHTLHEWLTRLDRLATGLRFKPSERALERFRQGFLVSCGVDMGMGNCGLESERPQSRRSKVANILESPQARLDALRVVALRADECEACRHIRTVTRQRLDLLLRALEDPHGRKVYHATHGLCLRHCIEAANLAEVPAALAELLSAQIARLRVLEWELGETSRKSSWSVRYEAKGPETSAWRRAAYQFCGV